MAPLGRTSKKRALEKKGKSRVVRTKREEEQPLPEIQLILVANMEAVRVNLCWTREQQREFRLANMYEFIWRSDKLPEVDKALVKEYLTNYKPVDGSSWVKKRLIALDEVVVEKVLRLPVGEFPVDGKEALDFEPDKYFKSGRTAWEVSQGWKVVDAITPEIGEWMRFVQRRLCLKSNHTYMAHRVLYATVMTKNGMIFNWAAFVTTKMHAELTTKRLHGKFASLMCSNYLSEVIKATLALPEGETFTTNVAPVVSVAECSQPKHKRIQETPVAPQQEVRNDRDKGKGIVEDRPSTASPSTNPPLPSTPQLPTQGLVPKIIETTNTLITQLRQIKTIVGAFEAQESWKERFDSAKVEYQATYAEQDRMLADKEHSMQVMIQKHNSQVNALVLERDTALSVVKAEHEAKEVAATVLENERHNAHQRQEELETKVRALEKLVKDLQEEGFTRDATLQEELRTVRGELEAVKTNYQEQLQLRTQLEKALQDKTILMKGLEADLSVLASLNNELETQLREVNEEEEDAYVMDWTKETNAESEVQLLEELAVQENLSTLVDIGTSAVTNEEPISGEPIPEVGPTPIGSPM